MATQTGKTTMERCMGCMAEAELQDGLCPHCGYAQGTPPREAYHMTPESILHARYIVGRVLGHGGFGVTYIGYDAQLDRKVAIKEFLPSTFATRMPGDTLITVYAGEATEQFEAGLVKFVEEAQRLAQFNGVPGIVDIYDTFIENNTGYIVMQFLEGRDVKAVINERGHLPYEEALPIVLSVAKMLKTVHAQGIIHRDISPDNIFLTTDGSIKLLDFGAARYATSVNSKSLSVILKSGYAPEEQYRSRGEQGPWSDVYALAATFYKMLTGITPEDAMERAIRDELQEPSALGSDIPKNAENALLNALQVRQANRTPDMAAFIDSFESTAQVERVKVKAKAEDLGKFPRWLKTALAAGSAAVVLFALLTVTGVIDFGQGNILAGIPDGMINAPGVVNMDITSAQTTAEGAGLFIQITGREYSDRVERDKIVVQDPLPGRLLSLDSAITVKVSGGSYALYGAADEGRAEPAEGEEGERQIPNVQYMPEEEAVTLLRDNGFYVYTTYVFSDTVAEGHVAEYGLDDELAGENGTLADHAYIRVSAGRAPSARDRQVTNPGWQHFALAGGGHLLYKEYHTFNPYAQRHVMETSVDDGQSWQRIAESYSVDGLLKSPDAFADGRAVDYGLYSDVAARAALVYTPGTPVRFRTLTDAFEGAGYDSNSYDLPEQLTFHYNSTAPMFKTVRKLTLEEASEALGNDASSIEDMRGQHYYLLEGEFEEGYDYYVMYLNEFYTVPCRENGMLAFGLFNELTADYYDEYIRTVVASGDFETSGVEKVIQHQAGISTEMNVEGEDQERWREIQAFLDSQGIDYSNFGPEELEKVLQEFGISMEGLPLSSVTTNAGRGRVAEFYSYCFGLSIARFDTAGFDEAGNPVIYISEPYRRFFFPGEIQGAARGDSVPESDSESGY
ncbi:protein kinase [Oscillospiraceae bacterium OttesenSCG-928-F05]|nr:protein kinase [Oscillospiraceae bacterium OttesenSCG-928-F05]